MQHSRNFQREANARADEKEMRLAGSSQGAGEIFSSARVGRESMGCHLFLQEAARRDRKKDIDALRVEGREGDQGGTEEGSRCLMMGNGFDGSEMGVFGEGAESKKRLPGPLAV